MAPKRRRKIVALIVVAGCALLGCGWLPADRPTTAPVAAHPDAPLFHAWKVTGHVLSTRALISAYDAAGFDGRTVTVSDGGYASPWSGSCDQAGRHKAPRVAAEIAVEHDIAATEAASLGLVEPILEYQLTCLAGTAPGLTVYVAGARATTCWAGVCYLLAR